MREIVFDTETTGLDPKSGDRLIEIGGVELSNRFPTGRHYHQYINPERDISMGAFEVHGLSREFLSDKPVFADIVDDFMEFVGDDGILVAHNANFDMGFINHELAMVGRGAFAIDRVVDTLALARHRNPAGPNSLDALCSRFGIDNTHRTLHGALLDAELLADVYIELLGGKQADLGLSNTPGLSEENATGERWRPQPRAKSLSTRLSKEDRRVHAEFVSTLGPDTIWKKYLTLPTASEDR